MTFLETILTLTLLVLVPWAVWSAIDLWRLRRDVDDLIATCGYLVDDYIDRRTTKAPAPPLVTRGTANDLDVPDVGEPLDEQPTTPTYRPMPPDFHTNR